MDRVSHDHPRPSPDALLRAARQDKTGGEWGLRRAAHRAPQDLPWRRARCRQDLRHAARRPSAGGRGHRRGRGRGGNSWPRGNARHAGRPGKSSRAAPPPIAAAPSTRWTSTPCSPAGRPSPWSTSWPTPTPTTAAIPSATTTSRSCSTPASTSSPPSTCSTSRASTPWWRRSPASGCAKTVPDRILDRADDIEAIDLAPDDLIQRLREGKVYVPKQAERALRNFLLARQPHRPARACPAAHGPARRRAAPRPHAAQRDPRPLGGRRTGAGVRGRRRRLDRPDPPRQARRRQAARHRHRPARRNRARRRRGRATASPRRWASPGASAWRR